MGDEADEWKRLKPERIEVSAADFEELQKRLADPPKPNAKLKALLRRKPIWNR